MKVLPGIHVSPESAYVVADYPYGFRLRCQIRYWVEFHPKRGFRIVSQTSNPKRGHIWNKPKASTYAKFGGALYLDDDGQVHGALLSEYSSGQEAAEWSRLYRDGVPPAGRDTLDRWVNAKSAYDNARKPGDPLHVGLAEARAAFLTTKQREK